MTHPLKYNTFTICMIVSNTTEINWITHPEAARYFMTLDEVVDVLTSSLEFPHRSLLLPDMGDERNIVDLAAFLMNLFSVHSGVRYVGLKASEKCREQLTYDYEYVGAADVQRPARILSNSFDRDHFSNSLARLLHLIYNRSKSGLIETLSQIVPEFVPSPTFLALCRQ